MASESGTLKFILLGEDRTASRALEGVGNQVDKTAGGLSKLSTVLGAAIGAAAVASITRFAVDSVRAFSELEDATQAAGVVFGSSMGQIIAQADAASSKLGMSKAQVIDAANQFGTFGKAAGLAGDDLAGFSVRMTELAADLSSFKGGTVEEAVTAIGAAMRGEMEPIRRYGVLLDDATLRQEALAMGLIKTTKEALTPQQRTLAAQSAILKQTSDATGDFARNQESTANVAKTLAAEQANLAAAIGETLAPSVKAGQQALIALMRAAQDNMAILPPLITAITMLGGAMLALYGATRVVAAVQAMSASLVAAQGAVETFGLKVLLLGRQMESTKVAAMGSAIMGLGRALPVAGAAILAAGAAWLAYSAAAEASRQRTEELTRAIQADSGALGENTRAAAVNLLSKQGLLEVGKSLGLSAKTIVDAYLEEADAVEQVRGAIEKANIAYANNTREGDASAIRTDENAQRLKVGMRDLGVELDNAREKAKLEAEAMGKVGDNADAATGPVQSLKSKNTELANSARDAAADLEKQRKALWEISDAALAASDKEVAYAQAKDGADKAIKEHTKSLGENRTELDLTSKAGQEVQSALNRQAAAAKASIQGNIELGASAEVATAQMARARAEFVANAQKAGLTAAAAEELANKYGLIPSNVTTDVKLRGDQQAKERTSQLIARINEVPKWAQTEFQALVNQGDYAAAEAMLAYLARARTVSIRAQVVGNDFRLPGGSTSAREGQSGRAAGGHVLAGQLYRVNEYGTEFFRPAVDGNIISARETAQMASSAADPKAIARALDGAILHLSGVDYMAGAVAARIQTSIERGV